jgi:hypothetical protein
MRRVLIHVVTPVAVGACVYLFWRSPELLVFTWVNALALDGVVAAGRAFAAGIQLAPLVLNSLPDGLWVYAMTMAMLSVWRADRAAVGGWLWAGSPLLLSLAGEFGQSFGVVRGTFDWADVGVVAGAACAAALVGGNDGGGSGGKSDE